MTRSGSPAAGKPKPAPARHPPAPPLRPGGTPDRPLSVSRVAVAFEPPGLAPVAENPEHQSLLGQLYLDGPSPTMPRHVDGAQSPAVGWSQLPCTPRATAVHP